jgi:hypothetical protein
MRASLLAVAAIAVLAGCGSFSPRHSEETLTQNILEEVPLGSSMEQVKAQIARHEWEVEEIDMDNGFYDQRTKPGAVRGSRSIVVDLGSYQGLPWEANAQAHWAFDSSNRLIDLWVWKTWDSL